MKRLILFTALCILFVIPSGAQQFKHTWKMGPLTWNDFTHKNMIHGEKSYIEYYMSIENNPKEIDGITYSKPCVTAFMSPEYSWADTAYRTSELLQYNQCIFDLIEVYRRKLEASLDNAYFYDYDNLLDNTMKRLADDVMRIEEETQQGSNVEELHRWQENVYNMLTNETHPTQYGHKDAPWRWGLGADLSTIFVGGKLHDYFGFGIGMAFNSDILYKHNCFSFGFTFNSNRSKDYVFLPKHGCDSSWALFPGDHLCVIDLNVNYGYAIIDNAHNRVTPFVGYGLQGFYYTPDDDGSSFGPGTGCFRFGVDFNHHFSNSVDKLGFTPDYYNASHSYASWHVKLYGTYNNMKSMSTAPTGFTINLQLGLSIMSGRTHCE